MGQGVGAEKTGEEVPAHSLEQMADRARREGLDVVRLFREQIPIEEVTV